MFIFKSVLETFPLTFPETFDITPVILQLLDIGYGVCWGHIIWHETYICLLTKVIEIFEHQSFSFSFIQSRWKWRRREGDHAASVLLSHRLAIIGRKEGAVIHSLIFNAAFFVRRIPECTLSNLICVCFKYFLDHTSIHPASYLRHRYSEFWSKLHEGTCAGIFTLVSRTGHVTQPSWFGPPLFRPFLLSSCSFRKRGCIRLP